MPVGKRDWYVGVIVIGLTKRKSEVARTEPPGVSGSLKKLRTLRGQGTNRRPTTSTKGRPLMVGVRGSMYLECKEDCQLFPCSSVNLADRVFTRDRD